MREANKLLLAYYGDDFTGSTDALEFLSRAGAKTVLFIEPPTPERLAAYPGIQAVGVAGLSRSMTPEQMEETLPSAFQTLKKLGAAHVHYKVCSTFDSSPAIGSIGKAIDIGSRVFEREFIPLVVAAPVLGRYCLFGNLFARMGIGSQGEIYRLDRHPSMKNHPVTPADESDLLLHLSKQTSRSSALLHILQLETTHAAEILKEKIAGGAEVILFDALYQEHLIRIGELIDAFADAGKPLFSAGSSGIEMALGSFWQRQGLLQKQPQWEGPGKAGPLLAASGSCSPVTSAQIAYAVNAGFAEIALDTEAIAAGDTKLLDSYSSAAAGYIREGRNVIIHTDAEKRSGNSGQDTAALYGTALGQIVRQAAEKAAFRRLVIAGGDTSSYAARAMGIEAVEMIAPLAPGAPLCRAYAPGSAVDGKEVNFKGGQVGGEDYFGMVLEGVSVIAN